MTELGFCTLFWELTGLFFALTVPLTHIVKLIMACLSPALPEDRAHHKEYGGSAPSHAPSQRGRSRNSGQQ